MHGRAQECRALMEQCQLRLTMDVDCVTSIMAGDGAVAFLASLGRGVTLTLGDTSMQPNNRVSLVLPDDEVVLLNQLRWFRFLDVATTVGCGHMATLRGTLQSSFRAC